MSIKRRKVCGVENLLIFVVPFSPPETLNTSFQLELALQINNGYREEKIKDRSCSGHDIPECPFVPEFVVTIFWELLQLALKPHQGVEMIEIQEALVSSKAPSVPLMHRWFPKQFLHRCGVLWRFALDVLLFSDCLCLVTASFFVWF